MLDADGRGGHDKSTGIRSEGKVLDYFWRFPKPLRGTLGAFRGGIPAAEQGLAAGSPQSASPEL